MVLWPKPFAALRVNGRLVAAKVKAPLMPRVERLALIRRPFQSQLISAKSWGGTNVNNAGCVPTEGHRTWQLSAADESYLRYGRSDDEGSAD